MTSLPRRFLTKSRAQLRAIPASLPLRVQLIVVLLVLVAVALLATGFAGRAALRGYLLTRIDDQLIDTAQVAIQNGRLPSIGGENSDRSRTMSDGPALTGGFFSKVADIEGDGNSRLLLPRNSDQTGPRLGNLSIEYVQERAGKPFTVDAIGKGDDWRVLAVPLPNSVGSLTVGSSLTDVRRTVDRLGDIQLIVGFVALMLLGLAGYAIVRSSLRKLIDVEQTAAAIAAGDLSRRVEVANQSTEIGRLGTALNTMLSTIETSFAAQMSSEHAARASEIRMRRFVADASHELRTPLTSIRGFAELQRQAVDLEVSERARLTGRIEAEAKRMGVLVEDLLLLARLDQQRQVEMEPVDIGEIVREACADAPVLAAGHNVSAAIDESENGFWINGDAARLRQILGNLLSNAYVHTPAGTDICVQLTKDNEKVSICVADNGPGLSEQDAARVFERFFRSDPSRTRASGGSGLGLSIVAALVEAQNGTISLVTSPGNGAAFTVTFPVLGGHVNSEQQQMQQ